ncbi:MAG: hypothetical protein JSS51_07925 [Planctomycetes bacterium]|nr:hypothetical protein [Planctomycetota bacterium]
MPRSGHSRLLSRVTAWVTVAVFICASFGVVPTPALVARWFAGIEGAATGVANRHPCDDHFCGCTSAHECWAACCCFTPSQRLAWAIENGVCPPSAVRFSDSDLARAGAEVTGRRGVVPVAVLRHRLTHGIATARGETSSPRTPGMSALGCKGLSQFYTLAMTFSFMESNAGVRAVFPRVEFLQERPQVANSRGLEIGDPPPRANASPARC